MGHGRDPLRQIGAVAPCGTRSCDRRTWSAWMADPPGEDIYGGEMPVEHRQGPAVGEGLAVGFTQMAVPRVTQGWHGGGSPSFSVIDRAEAG